jgi:hypothetical protein
MYHHHPSFLRAVILTSLLLFQRRPTPPQCPVTHFLKPDGYPSCSLRDLRSNDLAEGLIKCLVAPQTQLPSQASVPYAIVAFRSRPTFLFERPSFRGSVYNIILAWSLTTVSLVWFRNGMAWQSSSGNGKLLPGPTITRGPFFQLSAAPYS